MIPMQMRRAARGPTAEEIEYFEKVLSATWINIMTHPSDEEAYELLELQTKFSSHFKENIGPRFLATIRELKKENEELKNEIQDIGDHISEMRDL